jgi:outer membrane protein OmpA-like peptidoglycan-associated protein
MIRSLPKLQKKIYQIIVEDNTSSNGSEGGNKKLSLQRAISLIHFVIIASVGLGNSNRKY